MGFFVEREDSTNGKVIKTGDNVRIIETEEKGFVIAVIDDEYMVSVNGDVRNYLKDEIIWTD
ncbi:MAG: hypothetical protein HFJ44_00420 [Clostridia bacterium]|jgi:dsDNA-specific endonuclease/ATPase MutS2|nr:hypothetical protein [Clostridia bacterium]